jgi:hypothetical protein
LLGGKIIVTQINRLLELADNQQAKILGIASATRRSTQHKQGLASATGQPHHSNDHRESPPQDDTPRQPSAYLLS